MIQNKSFKNITLLALLLLVISGCAIPKVVILDDPLTPEEHINLGVAYERQDKFDAAISEYELASKKSPVGYLYLGNAYFSKLDTEKAEYYYKKMIDEDPGYSDAYNNLAWLYYTRGENLEYAEELVLKAIELNPDQKELYNDTLEKIRRAKSETIR
jgi:tetratricopeptide (TPR) repeat protein